MRPFDYMSGFIFHNNGYQVHVTGYSTIDSNDDWERVAEGMIGAIRVECIDSGSPNPQWQVVTTRDQIKYLFDGCDDFICNMEYMQGFNREFEAAEAEQTEGQHSCNELRESYSSVIADVLPVMRVLEFLLDGTNEFGQRIWLADANQA
jgi:hypothetical protein